MRQHYTGTFRTAVNFLAGGGTAAYNWNVADPGINSPTGQVCNVSYNSFGASLVDPIPWEGPRQNQRWQIIQISITAYLVWVCITSSGFPYSYFGRFGTVQAALFADEPIPPDSGPIITSAGLPALHEPWSAPVLNLPVDQSLAVTLWDPIVDRMPPTFVLPAHPAIDRDLPVPSGLLPISGIISPPIPIDVTPGNITPAIGLWINPMIIGQTNSSTSLVNAGSGGLAVGYGRYAINYDDGIPN